MSADLVLIVDSDPTQRLLARSVLEERGLRVAEVDEMADAIGQIEELRPNLVVIHRSGAESENACAALRRRTGMRHLPILMITPAEDARSAHRAYESGATDFVTRPIQWPYFAHRVQYMIRAGRAIETERRARLAAEAADRAKGSFLANVSHELRTPLTAVLGYVSLLREGDHAESDPEESLEIIERNSQHLLSLLDDILDFTKLEAGKVSFEFAPTRLRELVDGVVGLFQGSARQKLLSLGVDYIGPIPQFISTDATRLRQVLLNVLGNAIKFTETGGAVVAVRLEGRHDVPRIRVDVRDSGIGLPGDDATRLFDPFVQADATPARRFGGTGLGLSICKHLVQGLGGEITARNNDDGGCTVSFTVDAGAVVSADLESGAPAPRVPAERAQPPPLPASRVLLAEDGPDNQRLISHVLRRVGLSVEVACDGLEAVECALAARDAGEPYDLILMDVQMPNMDGLDATRRLREEGIEQPIIALTAHVHESDRQGCLQAGCDDFATKPIDRPRLLTQIAVHLSGKPTSD